LLLLVLQLLAAVWLVLLPPGWVLLRARSGPTTNCWLNPYATAAARVGASVSAAQPVIPAG